MCRIQVVNVARQHRRCKLSWYSLGQSPYNYVASIILKTNIGVSIQSYVFVTGFAKRGLIAIQLYRIYTHTQFYNFTEA